MSKGTVLITGLNGYIASVAAGSFLEAGYRVRGTVRRLSSAKAIEETFKDYGDKLEIVAVPDITIDGAFDEAVKGVTAIAHLASPVSLHFTDPDPVIHAALNGTRTILKSALGNAGPQLKSFVLLSSIAAVVSDHQPPYTYTEKDFNTISYEVYKQQGKNTPGLHIYRASKAAAEEALWDFGKAENPPFALTTINPS
jgi:nucleoside-diphosphate-sugar epimerase